MMNIFKVQLKLKNPKKTISILFFCTLCFSGLTIYMEKAPFNMFLNNDLIGFISEKLTFSYLSLLAITGPMTFLAFNGFIEDKPIFMSLIARKINIFHFVINKILASLVYSIFTIPLALIINKYYLDISIVEICLLISSELMLFYIVYFVIYMLFDNKKFDLIMAYMVVIMCILATLLETTILFLIILPMFISLIIFMYYRINICVAKSLFKTKITVLDCIKIYGAQLSSVLLKQLIGVLGRLTSNYKFLAIVSKDINELFNFFPKILFLHLVLFFVIPEYKLITLVLYQLIIISFLKKLYSMDTILLDLNLISYIEYYKVKTFILCLCNLIIQITFVYALDTVWNSVIISTVTIPFFTLLVLLYRKKLINSNI